MLKSQTLGLYRRALKVLGERLDANTKLYLIQEFKDVDPTHENNKPYLHREQNKVAIHRERLDDRSEIIRSKVSLLTEWLDSLESITAHQVCFFF